MAGSFVRDKDAVIASMLICEMAAWYKSRGMTLYDGLLALWEKYGYYEDTLKSVQMTGKEGMERIKSLMDGLRAGRLQEIGGLKVLRFEDYQESKAYDMIKGTGEEVDLPVSNVLKYIMQDGSGSVSGLRNRAQDKAVLLVKRRRKQEGG